MPLSFSKTQGSSHGAAIRESNGRIISAFAALRRAAEHRQLALGGLRFFSTSARVIIIIIGSTGHS